MRLTRGALALLMLAGCAQEAYNPGDPGSDDFLMLGIGRCLIAGWDTCGVYPTTPPEGLSNLVLWYRADSLSASLADGANVATWTDSTSAAHVAVAPGGNEPSFHAGVLNGFPVVRFNEVNLDFMDISVATAGSIVASVPQLSALLVSTHANGQNTVYLGGAGGGPPVRMSIRNGPQGVAGAGHRLDTDAVATTENYVSGLKHPPGTFSVQRLVFRYYQATASAYYNGLHMGGKDPFQTPGLSDAAPSTLLRIGHNNTTVYYSGDIAEFILYNGKHSETELRGVECYLSRRYAIAIQQTCF